MLKPIALVLVYNKTDNLKIWFQVRETNDELQGMLELPGGKIEKNETPVQAARREFLEEVGVDLKIEDLHLLKIHNHTINENIIFYIFAHQSEVSSLESNGWYEISLSHLESFRGRIPNENIVFLEHILRTL